MDLVYALPVELEVGLTDEAGAEVEASEEAAAVGLGLAEVGVVAGVMVVPGELSDVLGATVGVGKPAEGRDVILEKDNEVIFSADVKEERKTEFWETMSLMELKGAASADGLNGSSVIGDLKHFISLIFVFGEKVHVLHVRSTRYKRKRRQTHRHSKLLEKRIPILHRQDRLDLIRMTQTQRSTNHPHTLPHSFQTAVPSERVEVQRLSRIEEEESGRETACLLWCLCFWLSML